MRGCAELLVVIRTDSSYCAVLAKAVCRDETVPSVREYLDCQRTVAVRVTKVSLPERLIDGFARTEIVDVPAILTIPLSLEAFVLASLPSILC